MFTKSGRKSSKESLVLSQAKALLNFYKVRGQLSYRRIHVGAIPRGIGKQGYRFLSPNIDMSGMEDLQIYLRNGITLFVECKNETGKQSPEQKKRECELKNLDHNYAVIRSVDDLISLLEAHGLTTINHSKK